MYRGSSGLLQKNHKIHITPVEILLKEKYRKLRCNDANEISTNEIELILNLKAELAQEYSKINFTRGINASKGINPTYTLISKILLGTLGCCPAYDRYFISGLKQQELKQNKFDENSLIEMFNFIEHSKRELTSVQSKIFAVTKCHYPIMKILDMYYWQIGYDFEMSKKATRP